MNISILYFTFIHYFTKNNLHLYCIPSSLPLSYTPFEIINDTFAFEPEPPFFEINQSNSIIRNNYYFDLLNKLKSYDIHINDKLYLIKQHNLVDNLRV
jgi:hypothetical protein